MQIYWRIPANLSEEQVSDGGFRIDRYLFVLTNEAAGH